LREREGEPGGGVLVAVLGRTVAWLRAAAAADDEPRLWGSLHGRVYCRVIDFREIAARFRVVLSRCCRALPFGRIA
jgi:hypothetical protein